jgi:HAD superfamily hydrolase (TIGR01509 family)
VIAAVVFDLDGVLVDSEDLWDEARRAVAAAAGGVWPDGATEAMQGMSSPEWAGYLRREAHVELSEAEIVEAVLAKLLARLAEHLPVLPGAVQAVERLGRRWPLALASSANREVIDAVLAGTALRAAFAATVSSEEVRRGKPAPDVYLEAARRLGQPASQCVAIEDSANGIRSGVAAGMHVVAVPNRRFPPPDAVLSTAQLVLPCLDALTVEALERLDELEVRDEQHLDEEDVESFPASDPPSDWAGPPG